MLYSFLVHIATLRDAALHLLRTAPSGSVDSALTSLVAQGVTVSRRHFVRLIQQEWRHQTPRSVADLVDAAGKPLNSLVWPALDEHLRKKRSRVLFLSLVDLPEGPLLLAQDRRGELWWVRLQGSHLSDPPLPSDVASALAQLKTLVGSDLVVVPVGQVQALVGAAGEVEGVSVADSAHSPLPYGPPPTTQKSPGSAEHAHLNSLEAESVRIIREAVAVAKKPAMLFSMGKDSMVMLELARKAFWPEPVPFPLVMIDTRWKFQQMYRFREYIQSQPDLDVIVHVNPDAIRDDINPFDHGSARHTDVTKTQALKQVLDEHRFDFVFGGARRDEEKSRAKERAFSVRDSKHGWDPKNQRPELWNTYNTRLVEGQSMRVFPLSNWTELDVWRYVEREGIDVVPLYFSKIRPFVERNGSLIMVDDERFRRKQEEKIHFEPIRFRTLGCYPLTGGVRSSATTVAEIIRELENTRVSERSSRVIDFDPGASMEQKKKEGYF